MGNILGFERVTSNEIQALMLMSRNVYDAVPFNIDLDSDNQDDWINRTNQLNIDSSYTNPSATLYSNPI